MMHSGYRTGQCLTCRWPTARAQCASTDIRGTVNCDSLRFDDIGEQLGCGGYQFRNFSLCPATTHAVHALLDLAHQRAARAARDQSGKGEILLRMELPRRCYRISLSEFGAVGGRASTVEPEPSPSGEQR